MDKTLKKTLRKNQSKYNPGAWIQYDTSTLAHTVGFFAQRATHRIGVAKIRKDINDAKAYLGMLENKLLG